LGQQLRMGSVVQGDETPHRRLHRAPDGEQAMVLQDQRDLVRPQRGGDPRPSLASSTTPVKLSNSACLP
jgi:hypothetical protein